MVKDVKKSESIEHRLACTIIFDYAKTLFRGTPRIKILRQYPHFKNRAHADVAIVQQLPPRTKIKVWIEVQRTPLSPNEWREKIEEIFSSYKFEEIWIVTTPKTRKHIKSIWKIISEITDKTKIFYVDTRRNKLYQMKKLDGFEEIEIIIQDGRIKKRRVKRGILTEFLG